MILPHICRILKNRVRGSSCKKVQLLKGLVTGGSISTGVQLHGRSRTGVQLHEGSVTCTPLISIATFGANIAAN